MARYRSPTMGPGCPPRSCRTPFEPVSRATILSTSSGFLAWVSTWRLLVLVTVLKFGQLVRRMTTGQGFASISMRWNVPDHFRHPPSVAERAHPNPKAMELKL